MLSVSVQSISVRAKVLDLARTVFEVDDLWVAGEKHEIMCGSGRNCEAVGERNRRSGLQARNLDHPGGPRKVERECRPKIAEHLIRCLRSVIASNSVVDLNEVHPAHERPICH